MEGDSMTRHDTSMILMSGCLLIVWTAFKWKIPHVIWDNKWFRLFSRVLGIYSIIISGVSYFFKIELPLLLFIVNFLLILLLSICFILTKINKARKGIIRNLQIGICLLLIFVSVAIVFLDVNEVASGIAGLCGVIMVLTTPFEEIKPYLKSKNIDSNQV
jgi:energy-converting hydrogenase Eha subunit C